MKKNLFDVVEMKKGNLVKYAKDTTKKEVMNLFTLKVINEIKGVSVSKEAMEIVRDYLSNLTALNAINDVISHEFTNENLLNDYLKVSKYYYNISLKQVNAGFNNLHKAFITGDSELTNKVFKSIFNMSYDFYGVYCKVFGLVSSNRLLNLKAHSVSQFKHNTLSLLKVLIEKSGSKVDTKKFDKKLSQVIALLPAVRSSEMFTESVVRDIAFRFNIIENDYRKLFNKVTGLYSRAVLVLSDEDYQRHLELTSEEEA